ncbi:LysR family transcriptional regulator [Pseudidiomarina homiensis]|uniref:HTH lysR-type domain-containing protein n=1 Tax=Pseudidiomarina homiensis TaxID=364198 RepID=A0A432Y3Y7_9GAMM|nr:LysR family transcriptional regulator [Pseudidiomarina homiensis]RUO55688.1 hypothetical protein CWI70_02570 [Pseudidiomarina homiensis]
MLLKNYSLNALRVFAVAANASSFKHAAQQLGLSQSAVTRHIQTLEEQLGTQLFHRDNRIHALTPAGELLGEQLLALFQQLEQSVERARVSGDEALTTLRIYVPSNVLRWWLASRLADFTAIYPHIRLQLDTYDDTVADHHHAAIALGVQQGAFDLALVHGRIKDRNLKQQNLYSPRYAPVSAASDITTSGHWWVQPQSEAWQAYRRDFPVQAQALPVQAVAKPSIGLELVSNGTGSTLVDTLYLQHPAFRSLQCSQDQAVDGKHDVFVVTRQAARHPVAVVAFSKWLQSRVQQSL